MINSKTVNKGQEGLPKKKVLNFDEETYSELSRPEYFPIQIKVPKKVLFENTVTNGHPYFVDDNQVLWSSNGTTIYTKNLATNVSTPFKDMVTVDAETLGVEWVLKTATVDGNFNILVSLTVIEGNTGGRIYLSSDNGTTWVKVMDAATQGVASLFRLSNIWYHKVGDTEYIVVGSYGENNVNDDSSLNSVWISKDLGATWVKIYTPPLVASGTNNHIHSLCIAPHNGWLWVTHGDGNNRGIVYSHDALYAAVPTFTELSKGAFFKGGWQPSSVVSTILGASFGTDTMAGLPNGILSYDLPDYTVIDKIGFRAEVLHDDALTHIARKGAQINYSEAYIPMHISNTATKIFVTGDGGVSWHIAVTFPFGAFEKGMTNPDANGYVYGAGARFKVDQWESITKWTKGRFAEKPNYI